MNKKKKNSGKTRKVANGHVTTSLEAVGKKKCAANKDEDKVKAYQVAAQESDRRVSARKQKKKPIH